MEDHPVQFFSKRNLQVFCVFPDPFGADVYISQQEFAWLGKLETDDVCIGVMAQVFLVDFEEITICTKNVVDTGDGKSFPANHTNQEGFEAGSVCKEKRNRQVMKLN